MEELDKCSIGAPLYHSELQQREFCYWAGEHTPKLKRSISITEVKKYPGGHKDHEDC